MVTFSYRNFSFTILCIVIITLSTELKYETRVHFPAPKLSPQDGITNVREFALSVHSDEDVKENAGYVFTSQRSFIKKQREIVRRYDNNVVNTSSERLVMPSTHPPPNGTKAETNGASIIRRHPGTACRKKIQLWSPVQAELLDGEYECPAENCKVIFVKNSSYDQARTSNAVILHHAGSWEWGDLRRYRPEGQMWIFTSKEPRPGRWNSRDPEHLFHNWTMTFRRDADFTIPYGRYTENVTEVPADDTRNWASGKTKLIAWMASNCNKTVWQRTAFVRNLSNFIQVDTYGACGALDCVGGQRNCREMLNQYKFYLALENSACKDYITEKFWVNALKHNSVPIVYGTNRTDYEKVAPPDSFIHLNDFRNITSFVDYIMYLDKNDTAYNEYFNWKKMGSVNTYSESDTPSTRELCAIVRKLKEQDELNKATKGEPSKIASNTVKASMIQCPDHQSKNPWS